MSSNDAPQDDFYKIGKHEIMFSTYSYFSWLDRVIRNQGLKDIKDTGGGGCQRQKEKIIGKDLF